MTHPVWHYSGVLLISTVLLMAQPMAARALEPGSWYGQVSAGKAWIESYTHTNTVTGVTDTENLSSEWGLGGAIGYAFRSVPLRLEGEYTYYHALTSDPGGGGDTERFHVGMANAYYDLHLGDSLKRWQPYVGFGVGFAVDDMALTRTNGTTYTRHDSAFAYQVKSGVAYELTPSWDMVLGYRYLHIGERSWMNSVSQLTLRDPVNLHFFEVGLRTSLNFFK